MLGISGQIVAPEMLCAEPIKNLTFVSVFSACFSGVVVDIHAAVCAASI